MLSDQLLWLNQRTFQADQDAIAGWLGQPAPPARRCCRPRGAATPCSPPRARASEANVPLLIQSVRPPRGGYLQRMRRLLAASSLALASVVVGQDGAARARSPHIVFVLADDMGYGDPAFGRDGTRITTPNIDRLAREGVRFTDAHASSMVRPATAC